MSFIGNAVNAIGNAIGNAASTVANVVGSVVSNPVPALATAAAAIGLPELLPSLGGATAAADAATTAASSAASDSLASTIADASTITSGVTGSVLSGPAAALAGASSTTGGLFSSIASGLGSLISGAGSVAQAVSAGANTGITGTIASLVADIQSFLSPIVQGINSITNLANEINNNLVQPIVAPITNTIYQTQQLIQGFHTDLTQGLAGIVQIPGQISDALTGIDASFNRAMQQLNTGNAHLVTDQMIPAFATIAGKPIQGLQDAMMPPVEVRPNEAAQVIHDSIAEPYGTGFVDKMLAGVADYLNTRRSFAANFMEMAANLVTLFLGLFGAGLSNLQKGKQTANVIAPIAPLSPGEAIAAIRRGLIPYDEGAMDARREGVPADRFKVLHDLSLYLFSPVDAVALMMRGFITEKEFRTIAGQHGMDAGQQDALLSMQQYLWNPGEASALTQRALIDKETFFAVMKKRGYDQAEAQAALDLATSPINPAAVIRSIHREQAAQSGFLASTLGQRSPQSVYESMAHAGFDPAQADMEWISHWRVPDINWWVQALYRGLRTFEEFQQAARLHAIPDEVIADYPTVLGMQLSAFQLPSLMKGGLIPESQARSLMKMQGMLPQDIDLLIEYAKVSGKTTKAAMAGDLAGLSVASAGKLYTDGAINDAEYEKILVSHGYGTAAATLTMELAKLTKQAADRKANIAYIVDQVKVGILTRSDAQSQLYNSGYTQAEVDAAMVQIDHIKVLSTKGPSEAQLNKMLKDGVIDPATWETGMLNLGFDPKWLPFLIQII